jgi:hypothetical protein
VWTSSQTIGNAGIASQSYTFIVNGTLNIDATDKITFAGTANSVTFTLNGTLSIDETADETFLTSDVNFAYFIFSADSKLISNNYRGIFLTGRTNLIFEDDVDFRFLFDPEADFEFINTSVATDLYGLNDTVGTLTIAATGLITRVRTGTVLVVTEELIISSGTLYFANLNLRLASTASFNHSAGTLEFTSGDFYIDGLYTHSSGTFTHTACEVLISSTGTIHLNSGVFNMQSRTMTVAGTITRTAGSIYFNPTFGDLIFTNTTQITIPQNAFLNYPDDILLNGAGGVVLGGNTRPAATDTVNDVTLTLGNLTLTSGITAITRIIGSGGNIIGNQTASLVFTGTITSTLYMDQTTPGISNALGTLALNGSASNITLGTNLYIQTTLTLNSRILALGAFTLTKNGNFSKGTETINLNTGVFEVLGSYTHINSGTLSFFPTGTLSVGSLVLPSGNLNISSGTLQIGGTVSRTTGTVFASNGTVEFVNASSVNIPSNTFIRYPLICIINGAGGVVFNGNTRTATDSFPNLTLTQGSLSRSQSEQLCSGNCLEGLGMNSQT